MSFRHKIQQKKDKKSKALQNKIKRLQLPKITQNKVEQVNAFLIDPLKETNLDSNQVTQQLIAAQPWMDDKQQSNIAKRKRAIRLQISHILGDNQKYNQNHLDSQELKNLDPIQIIRKMRKYQPTNSSFSIQYGQRKIIEQRQGKNNELTDKQRKQYNFPTLNLYGTISHRSPSKRLNIITQMHSERLENNEGSKTSRQNEKYISKIKQIYKEGQKLHHKSQFLISKIDKVSLFLQNKFTRFKQESTDMIADVGNYHLQEQTNGQYKKDLMMGIPLRLRK